MSSDSQKAPSSLDSRTTVDEFDSPDDRKLLRKLDAHLLPILTLLYLLNFLDRANIGNAKIDGLTTALHVPGSNYNISLALYFVAYVLFEVPSNIILKRFNPQYWLPFLTLIWGIVSICQGLIKNQAGLYGIRFLLGMTEAGLFPGAIYLISVYYRRRERHSRVAIFFGGAALAGASGGILAYLIGKMDGLSGRAGWEWIFIIEGLITVFVSLLAFFIVPTWPHLANFLSEAERARLLARLSADSDSGMHERFQWQYVRQAFSDNLVWAYAFLFQGFVYVLVTLSIFLPTIIAELGFQTWKAQLMTVPPNVLAAFSIWGTVYFSNRYKLRAPFIIAAAVVAIIGYIVLIATKRAGAQYAGVHFAVAGVYTGNAVLLSWPGENVSGQTKRAVAVAMQITIGNVGSIAGVLIYRPQWATHQFRKPHCIAVGYLCFAILAASYLWTCMARENRRRDALLAGVKDEKLVLDDEGIVDRDEEKQREGDRHVDYRYQI